MLVTNIGRHYQEIHSTEAEVLRLNQATSKKERHSQLAKLCLLRDYHHNFKVLQLQRDLLFLVRRPTHGHTSDVRDYLPCTLCIGSIHAKDLWRHMKHCSWCIEPIQPHSYNRYQAESRLLLVPVMNDCSSAGPAVQQVSASCTETKRG